MKARLPQGFGSSGPGNLNSLMKQAQKMQEDSQKFTEEFETREFTSTSGGGMVEATVSGALSLKSVKIKPEAVDPEDVEMLEDLVVSAINGALQTASKTKEEEMAKITGNLSLPF